LPGYTLTCKKTITLKQGAKTLVIPAKDFPKIASLVEDFLSSSHKKIREKAKPEELKDQ
jgi:hypothetical protein